MLGQWDDCPSDPAAQCIILKIGVLYWRLADLYTMNLVVTPIQIALDIFFLYFLWWFGGDKSPFWDFATFNYHEEQNC